MSRHGHDLQKAPTGHATYADPGSLPQNRCQKLFGFLPARLGVTRPSLIPHSITKTGITATNLVAAVIPYYSITGTTDRLLLLDNTANRLHSASLSLGLGIYTTIDGKRRFSLDSVTFAEVLDVDGASVVLGTVLSIRWAQFEDELFLVGFANGEMYRYRSNVLRDLGLSAPAAPTQADNGAGVLVGVYDYLVVWVDELGRESSISATVTTATLASRQIRVTRPAISGTSTVGITHWNVYRQNPGSSVFNLVNASPIVIATTTYDDNITDAVVAASQEATTDGQNDEPAAATNCIIWKNRLVLNKTSDPNAIQISNAGAPTQFSSLPLPTNTADGILLDLGNEDNDAVSGFAVLGSLLIVLKTRTIVMVTGDTVDDFTVREIAKVGCVNGDTIQVTDNMVIFQSHDGIYRLAGDFTVVKISDEIEDEFHRFFFQEPVGQVIHGGTLGMRAVELGTAEVGFATSAVHDHRYYLSQPDKTLVFDPRATERGGWADAGYKAVRCMGVYRGSYIPETMFMSGGDTYSARGSKLFYVSTLDQPDDPNIPDDPVPEYKLIVTHPFDGDSAYVHRSRTKRALTYKIEGVCGYPYGTVLGTLTVFTDRGYSQPYDIVAGYARTPGALFEQGLGPAVTGRLIWFEEKYTVRDVTLTDRMLEYVPVN